MAQTVVEMSGDEAKLWQSMQRVVNQQDKLDKGFKKVRSSSDRANNAAVKSSREMISTVEGVGRLVTAYEAVGDTVSRVGQITSAVFARVRQESDETVQNFEKLLDVRRAIIQLGNKPGSGQLAKRYEQSDQLAISAGISRDQAAS